MHQSPDHFGSYRAHLLGFIHHMHYGGYLWLIQFQTAVAQYQCVIRAPARPGLFHTTMFAKPISMNRREICALSVSPFTQGSLRPISFRQVPTDEHNVRSGDNRRHAYWR